MGKFFNIDDLVGVVFFEIPEIFIFLALERGTLALPIHRVGGQEVSPLFLKQGGLTAYRYWQRLFAV